MDNEIINASLRRSIKSGSEYDQYIPKSTCKVQSLGNGKNNTIEGVNFMADWVKNHSYQVKKLAKVLKKSSLQETVASIWQFLFYHFQYDADGQLQKLRSPACSWAERKIGIDCKSYTIFACALLREMGYNSYIRQIKQPGYFENEFTHVYAIVPVDQSKSSNTSYYTSPYYVVDATVSDNKEPNFLEAKDKLMSGLTYQGMKGKYPSCPPKKAKLVTKASNAGRRLYKGKSSGGRDLAKWRHGSLKAPAQNSIITKLYKYEALIIALGFPQTTFNAMLQYAYTLIESNIPANQIILFFEPNGFKIGVENRQGMLFRHPYLSGQAYIEKFKQVVKRFANTGLNSPNQEIGQTSGGGGGFDPATILSDIDFGSLLDSIGGFFANTLGIGSGGWFTPEMFEQNLSKINDMHLNIVESVNQAIANQNWAQFSTKIADLKTTSEIMRGAFNNVRTMHNWDSSRTRALLDKSIEFAQDYHSKLNQALNAYLQTYYTQNGFNGSKQYSSLGWEQSHGIYGLGLDPKFEYQKTVQITQYTPQQNKEIPYFEINQGLLESIISKTPVNTSNFLQTLQNIALNLIGNNNNPNTSPNTGTGSGNTNQGSWNGIGQNTKTSSLMWFGIALASGYVFRKPIMNALNSKSKK